MQELKNKKEINNFFDELKNITLNEFAEGRKIEYQHSSAVSPITQETEKLSVNTYQINI